MSTELTNFKDTPHQVAVLVCYTSFVDLLYLTEALLFLTILASVVVKTSCNKTKASSFKTKTSRTKTKTSEFWSRVQDCCL